ncbi:MAG: hypothetical protein H8M99_11060 [Gloeobacteraceae cyanobacterium ES-bin-144]|nr:hypothetical protein [Verrucomicrobiales bacterium]
MPLATASLSLAVILSSISCTTLRSAASSSVSAMSNLLPGPRIQVVEPRHKDLKEMKLGHERALAYAVQKQQKNRFWIFGGPVDFKEPTLPAPGSELDGSLLPPLPPE